MSIWRKLFSPTPNPTLILHCSRCKTAYRLGEDSTVTTMSRGLSLLKGAVGSAEALAYPDMVLKATATSSVPIAEQLQIAREEVDKVLKDMAQGKRRQWYCATCANFNAPYMYPKFSP
jgi:hypothetical protein